MLALTQPLTSAVRMGALMGGLALALGVAATPAGAVSKSKALQLPGGAGTLTANVWRESGDGERSGNALIWEWQVSAAYEGGQKVKRIRATWYSQASLRNAASISMGVGIDGVSASSSDSWSNTASRKKYWENTNGAKSSSERSNLTVGPRKHYKDDSIYTEVRGRVKVSGDKRQFTIASAV